VKVTPHKRFRLSFVNAAEDVPRLIRAYGRACFGEFALVLRPSERRGVMVRLTKEGAWSWRAGEGDAPVLPAAGLEPKEAVALVKTEQKAVPKPGPITLRGQWAGWLHCEDGVPRVELTRKLAAYGLLRVTSTTAGWTWTVERIGKWFSQPGSDTGTAITLVGAIEAGLARAMGLLGEACSTRDSHRRAALDEAWGKDHPVRPAKEGQDPTERLRPRAPRRTKAGTPPRMDPPVSLPDAPSTPAGVARMAEEVLREADALATQQEVSWVWQDSTALQDAAVWFRGVGLEHLAEDLQAYDASPDHPPERLLQHLRSHLVEIELDEETRKDADGVLGKLEEAFRTASQVLERARRLVRHAARLTESELCQGQERKRATDAISHALHAYDEARAAIAAGETGETRAKVRSTVEWAALAAAKVARSCAAGQTALPGLASRPGPPDKAKRPPAATRGRKRREPEAPAPAPDPPRTRKAPQARAAEPAPAPPQARPRRKVRPEPAPAPEPPQKGSRKQRRAKAAPEGDAEKDKLLMEAFRDAVTSVMSDIQPD
jgi:hypothetical protein